MRRLVQLLVSVVLVLSLAAPALAEDVEPLSARDPLLVDWDVKEAAAVPDSIVEGCYVTNNTEEDLEQLRFEAVSAMSGERVTLDILDSLVAGGNARLEGTFRVSEASDWAFAVTARTLNGDLVESSSASRAFGRGDVLLDVRVDEARPAKAGTVRLTWTVTNSLKADVQGLNATLFEWSDGGASEQPLAIQSRDTLAPRETWTFETPVDLKQTGRYLAQVAFIAPNGKSRLLEHGPFELVASQVVWEAEWDLSSSHSVPASVEQLCAISNLTATDLEEVSFEAIEVNGDRAIILDEREKIEAGGRAELSGTMHVNEPSEWRFRIRAQRDEELVEAVAGKTCAFGVGSLVVHATSSETELASPGSANVLWSVVSAYDADVSDLLATAVPCSSDGTPSETQEALLAGRKDSLAGGEEWSFQQPFDIGNTGSYIFEVSYVDPDGERQVEQSEPMEFTVSEPEQMTLSRLVAMAAELRAGQRSLRDLVVAARQLMAAT